MIDPEYDIKQGDSVWKKRLAMEEILDLPGLSKVRKILEKYNLSSVSIDYKLNIYLKHNKTYNPVRSRNLELKPKDT